MGDTRNDPSMEDILASIKRIIAEDGAAALGARAEHVAAERSGPETGDGVLELTDAVVVDTAPELVSADAAMASRQSLAALSAVAVHPGTPPASDAANPLEAVVRELLRPMLKEWLDARLPAMVEDMVAREISRITGRAR